MDRKPWLLLLATNVALLASPACQPTSADGDGDGDVDTDGDTDTDADGGGDAWPCAQSDASSPLFRLTAMHQNEPRVLAIPAIQGVLDASLDDLQSLWLMELDLEAGTMSTGAGVAAAVPPTNDEEFCSVGWRPEYPAVTNVPITVDGDTVSTASPVERVLFPVFGMDGELLLELNLMNVELTGVVLNAERTLVGSPHPRDGAPYELAESWETAGTITGWMSWDDALITTITGLDQPYCTLLCGRDCSEVEDPETDCTVEAPQPIPGSSPEVIGWPFTAEIGYGAVTLD